MAQLPAVLGLVDEERSWLTHELMDAVSAAAKECGRPVVPVRTEDDEAACDVVIAIGHPWMFPDLRRRPQRAKRLLWYGEWLPPRAGADQAGPAWAWLPHGRRVDAAARGALDVAVRAASAARWRGLERRLLGAKEGAAIAREGERHLREIALGAPPFDEVVVTSYDKAAGAARAGVTARVVPFGYHETLCGPITAPDRCLRDLPVVFIGSLATSGFRRARVLEAVEGTGLFPLHVVHGGVLGSARHALLRRARVVLDIHRAPGNMAAIRWLHATAAGAVLVTEPFEDARPLVPDTHFVQAGADDLARATAAILADEPRRRSIVERSQALLRDELHMRTSLRRLTGGAGC